MEKVLIQDVNSIGEIICNKERSIIISKNTEIIKIYKPEYLRVLKKHNIDKEKMILSSEKFRHFKELVLPKKIYYKICGKDRKKFVGFSMDKIAGNSYLRLQHLTKNYTLEEYAKLYNRFERILNKANRRNIIITDFSNPSNIYFEGNEKYLYERAIRLIDYDDMQVEDCRTVAICNTINSPLAYSKQFYQNERFTTNINQLSLIYFYLTDVFNPSFPMNKINSLKKYKRFIEYLGIDDIIILRTLSKILTASSEIHQNHISDILFRISELYNKVPIKNDIVDYKLKRKSRIPRKY